MESKITFNVVEYNSVDDLKKLYSIQHFGVYEITFTERLFVVFVEFESAASLSLHWQRLNSTLSVELKQFLQTDFSRWNFYVFLIAREKVSNDIKYAVENNKFSSRKIVIDNYVDAFDVSAFDKIIIEHITNTDLISENDKEAKEPTSIYYSDSVVWSVVGSVEHSFRKSKDDQARLEQVLGLIENKLKNEIQES